ncbi:MAG: hypothetical protein WCO03_01415 [bacterium]
MIVSLLLLASLVGGLWYVGYRDARNLETSKNLAYASKKVDLSASSSLATFTTAEDFFYQLSTSSRLEASSSMNKIAEIVQNRLTASETVEHIKISELTTTYTASDLKITDNESSSSLKTFGLGISQALAPLSTKRPAEAPLVVAAIDKYDPAIVNTLENSANSKSKVLKNLLAIPTPRSGVELSLRLINSLDRMVLLLGNMKQVKTKPVLALESSLLYSDTVKRFGLEVIETNLYFRKKGIRFDKTENAKVYFDLNK